MVALEHFGSEAVAIATGALTVFVLIFGEIVPKPCAPNTRLPPSNFSRISSIGRKALCSGFIPVGTADSEVDRRTGAVCSVRDERRTEGA